MKDDELIKIAEKAQGNAYAPFSRFRVGAALQAQSGKIYIGVNVENSSYGLTNCAERSAVFAAVTEGDRQFEKIAIFSSCSPPATPCGACRQVLNEFAPDLKIICANDHGEVNSYQLSELLPKGFRLHD